MTSDKLKQRVIQIVGQEGPVTDEFLRDVDLEINKNPVTSMPDGRQLNQDLENIVNYGRRIGDHPNNEKIYIAMIDIDYFGDVNKIYGEHTGNQVLVDVNKIITQTLREDDQLANKHNNYHLHGEEMVAIYRCRNLDDALKVAERIRKEVQKKSQDKNQGYTGLEVTISLGVAEYNTEMEQYEAAQDRADKYMQVAKKEGRNRIYSGDEDPLYEFKEKYLYKQGISEAAAKYIAESVKGAKGLIGKTLTQLYSAVQKMKNK
ncbi:MAG: GGDEF domain-containing protein [Nanoarchaeota archaeon]|nr:GGDEF domain-containing protein [Nanoarchaeota archaeon]